MRKNIFGFVSEKIRRGRVNCDDQVEADLRILMPEYVRQGLLVLGVPYVRKVQVLEKKIAVLPPENATGNWVKVVQRVPVRLHLDEADLHGVVLQAGLSVNVSVDTGHRRHLFGRGSAVAQR